ncbi:hypothetical protein [Novosphingobium sp.]|uniref:hypothetical protein n=1 Tax=Novosphingobium sp. TaxID=1874826 RepID=UPI00286EAFF3|nr:hypothetical protein [Novosphingobium sp.]
MSSFVQIANAVAVHVGTEARITDPGDNRTLARTVREVWDLNRRAALRDGKFDFAMRTVDLAALAGTVPGDWQSMFQEPAESLRLVEVLTEGARDTYRHEGRVILCNVAGPLSVRVVVDVTEPALWDESFAEAFAARIAWRIGKRIAGSAYSEQAGEALYRSLISTAKKIDAQQEPPIEQEESDWITARFT